MATLPSSVISGIAAGVTVLAAHAVSKAVKAHKERVFLSTYIDFSDSENA